LDKWKVARVMSRENNLSKTKNSQKFTKQFVGLTIVTVIVIAFFGILNGYLDRVMI
jgi:nitric oxide reductase large subunit